MIGLIVRALNMKLVVFFIFVICSAYFLSGFPETVIIETDAQGDDRKLDESNDRQEPILLVPGGTISVDVPFIEQRDLSVVDGALRNTEAILDSDNSIQKTMLFESLASFDNDFSHKMDPLLLTKNKIYKIDRHKLKGYRPGESVSLSLDGKEIHGKVVKNNHGKSSSFLSIDLTKGNGRLTLQFGENRILGRLRENGVSYHIEGYNDEIIMINLVEYKIENDALKHD